MNISYFNSKSEMSAFAADLFYTELKQNPNLLLCAATGNSPAEFYALLANKAMQSSSSFEQLRVLQLDEWGGLSRDNPHSCFAYIKKHLLNPLNISMDRFIGFDTSKDNLEKECGRIQRIIDREGPIDQCVLGLGTNGHLGFNEPADSLQANCHIADLEDKTQQHSMVRLMDKTPSYGLTVGMKDILQSKRIILLITGEKKDHVINKLLKGRIDCNLPASFLWLHPDVECLIDRSSSSSA